MPELGPSTLPIAVVIPCYRVIAHISDVLGKIGPEADRIYCVDDACPEGSGDHIEKTCKDPRVVVLRNEKNLGVGGATLRGFCQAADDGALVIVKLDGDGQMDPSLLSRFARPIVVGRADYTKGNRFYHPSSVRGMPLHRTIGNAALSFVSKLSSGYWDIFDPTNGFVAIHSAVLQSLPTDRISKGYFFESDMLFNLNIVGAVVEDVPMDAVYGNERSNLRAGRAAFVFLFKHIWNFLRRLVYNYYLRNFTVGSVEIVLGTLSLLFGVVFGITKWTQSIVEGVPVTAGTVMLAGLPVIVGIQLLISFLSADVRSMPRVALHKRLG